MKREDKNKDIDLPSVTNVRIFSRWETLDREDEDEIGAWNYCGIVTFSDGQVVTAKGDYSWSLKLRLRVAVQDKLDKIVAEAKGTTYEQRMARKTAKMSEKAKSKYT